MISYNAKVKCHKLTEFFKTEKEKFLDDPFIEECEEK